MESIPDDSPWQLSHLLILIVAMIALAILGLYLYGDPNLPRLPLF